MLTNQKICKESAKGYGVVLTVQIFTNDANGYPLPLYPVRVKGIQSFAYPLPLQGIRVMLTNL